MQSPCIYFASGKQSTLESFIQFPEPCRVPSMSDANWGPQELCLYPNHLLGPLHWRSKHQLVTAGSSAEAKIDEMDECVKFYLN
jgi:hypothetical protein